MQVADRCIYKKYQDVNITSTNCLSLLELMLYTCVICLFCSSKIFFYTDTTPTGVIETLSHLCFVHTGNEMPLLILFETPAMAAVAKKSLKSPGNQPKLRGKLYHKG